MAPYSASFAQRECPCCLTLISSCDRMWDLPCRHLICRECHSRMQTEAGVAHGHPFNCPVCRKVTATEPVLVARPVRYRGEMFDLSGDDDDYVMLPNPSADVIDLTMTDDSDSDSDDDDPNDPDIISVFPRRSPRNHVYHPYDHDGDYIAPVPSSFPSVDDYNPSENN